MTIIFLAVKVYVFIWHKKNDVKGDNFLPQVTTVRVTPLEFSSTKKKKNRAGNKCKTKL